MIPPEKLREWANGHIDQAAKKRQEAHRLIGEAEIHEQKAKDLERDADEMEQ